MDSSDVAELSSIANSLEDILRRIDQLSRRYEGTPREDDAIRLRDVERGLGSALRRLEAAVRDLR